MKVTKKQFKEFKAECDRMITLLGLTQYMVDYEFKKLEHAYAEVIVNEIGKRATVYITTDMSAFHDRHFDLLSTARHEIFHLLTHRLLWLGASRYIENTDLEEEWEAVTRRLENFTNGSN